jgi:CO/xanthine dehydrogenase Mo-binding subunit
MSVGASTLRRDAYAKVTGGASYPSDLIPSDALVGKVVFTNQPHARLLKLDLAAANAIPGVVTIVSSIDVPRNEYGLTMFDQPVFVGLEHTGMSEVPCNISRWEADALCFIVAHTHEACEAAAAAIVVEWESLPIVNTVDEALATGVLIHPENGLDTNAYTHYVIRKGDPKVAWEQVAVTVESDYEFPYQEHAYLQPEAGLSYIDDEGRITVEVAGQWTYEDLEQIAHALDTAANEIRVIYPAIGGAFGGREDMTLQIVLALAAKKVRALGFTQKIGSVWSREESIVGHHKRHRGRVHAKWGADASGKLLVCEADCYLDAGGYNYTTNKVLGNLHLAVCGAYEVPNARVDSYGVYTNAAIGGAFRGFGGPQGSFVAESQMNKLARALSIDPVEIRRRNILREGSIGITQVVMPAGVTLPQVLDACAAEALFDEPLLEAPAFSPIASLPPQPSAIRRGRGIACAFKNVGFSFGFPERCEAEVHLFGGDGDETPTSATLFHGGADVGQGAHTAFLQMTAEAVGLPVESVQGIFSDTSTSGDSGSASASRLTWMSGNSILGAAEEAEKAWRDGARPAVGRFRYVPPPTEALSPVDGSCTPNFTYGYVSQAVELSVDTETGHIVIDRVVSAHDVGRAVNPLGVVGQIEGCVVQAHGYALSEDLQVHDGHITNPRFSGYLIPGIGDIPKRVDSVVLELADPLGPFGVRGMSEMPFMTYAPAVTAALFDATGIWFDQFPLTPSRVLAGLRAQHQ